MLKYVTMTIFLFSISSVCFADKLSMQINGLSYHLSQNDCYEKCNTVNEGYGFTFKNGGFILAAGRYNNTFYKTSEYLSAGYQWELKYADLSVVGAIATGYTTADVIPAVLFGASAYGINLSINPKMILAVNIDIFEIEF